MSTAPVEEALEAPNLVSITTCAPCPPTELADPAPLTVESTVEEALESIPLGGTVEGLVVPGACMCIESGAFEAVWKPGFLPVDLAVET